MQDYVTLSDRGGLTIPAKMREILGLKGNDRLMIEDTPEGLLLRPTFSIPIEIYTDEKIAEFTRDDEAVLRILGVNKTEQAATEKA